MDTDAVFDNVKFEKAKAMERYTRFQNMIKLLQIFEVIVAICVISWSWTRVPAAVKLSGEVLVQFSGYIFKPHVVFLIGNGIIVAIVVLCRQNDAGSNSSVADIEEIHVSEVPVSSLAPPPQTAEVTAALTAEFKAEPTENKEIVLSECKTPVTQCNDVEKTIDIAKKQIQKFKRTQSEKLKREITSNPRRELRRSETDTRRKLKVPEEAVDTMSNEEFRLTIEAFIKKNQIFFEKQRRAESSEHEKYEPKGIEAF